MDGFLESLTRLPTPTEMNQWDQKAVEFGLPEVMLMENAGRAIYEAVEECFSPPSSVAIFMGSGNNGGDAACLGRQLRDHNFGVTLFSTKDQTALSRAASFHLELAIKNGVNFVILPELHNCADLIQLIWANCKGFPSLFVDGLLGTGFFGQIREPLESIINWLNEISAKARIPILSIDIPSGLNAITGLPSPIAIKSALTVTLAAPKTGLFFPAALSHIAKLVCRSIHIPKAVYDNAPSRWRLLNGENLLFPVGFERDSFKNSYGHVYVFGGKPEYAGAGQMAALGALRAGAGLVTLCSSNQRRPGIPEIMSLYLGGDWKKLDSTQLEKLCESASALVLGPGLGRDENARHLVETILSIENRPPLVIDADALFHLAHLPSSVLKPTDILTPHPGEAATLLNSTGKDIQADRRAALDELCAKYPALVVLKGACTVIGQNAGLRLLCPYDIPHLAIGGAGDILAGCIAGTISGRQRQFSFQAAVAYGVLWHAIAGLALAKRYPNRGFLASQIANELPKCLDFIKSHPAPVKGQLPWPA